MECPTCHGETEVLDSHTTEHGVGIRRRRRCLSCGERLTTYELPDNLGARYRAQAAQFADELRQVIDRFEAVHQPH
jgi:transcription repressor NrdR-like protein